MRPYLFRSPATPETDAELRLGLAVLNKQPLWAGSVLATHRSGFDGWCEGCLAEGMLLLYPCPQTAMAERACKELRPEGEASAPHVDRPAGRPSRLTLSLK